MGSFTHQMLVCVLDQKDSRQLRHPRGRDALQQFCLCGWEVVCGCAVCAGAKDMEMWVGVFSMSVYWSSVCFHFQRCSLESGISNTQINAFKKASKCLIKYIKYIWRKSYIFGRTFKCACFSFSQRQNTYRTSTRSSGSNMFINQCFTLARPRI